ncbi:unnamed protein product [Caenorhabditis bovis]|uniref:T20D4.11-like domain-containing protein n=1 Tax=Caenorhabditis bovis TaxID=2654633 RepID=A0A8S1EW01_9PELO|nr:unnamed protein product [Caenorhabditis bovis]
MNRPTIFFALPLLLFVFVDSKPAEPNGCESSYAKCENEWADLKFRLREMRNLTDFQRTPKKMAVIGDYCKIYHKCISENGCEASNRENIGTKKLCESLDVYKDPFNQCLGELLAEKADSCGGYFLAYRNKMTNRKRILVARRNKYCVAKVLQDYCGEDLMKKHLSKNSPFLFD